MVDHTLKDKAREIFECIQKQYRVIGKIGQGTYGNVYKAADPYNPDEKVAIKNFKPNVQQRAEGIPLTAINEIYLLRELSHPNLVGLRDIAVDPAGPFVFMVYEYLGSDLEQIISQTRSKGYPPFEVQWVRTWMHGAFAGMDYLHKNWVLHRDIKPSNILVDLKTAQIKLADFGMARICRDPLRRLADDGTVVTIWYRAPELALGAAHYTGAIDVWATGCILFEVLKLAPLFQVAERNDTRFQQALLEKMFKVLGSPTPAIWPDLVHHRFYVERGVSTWPVVPPGAPLLRENTKELDLLMKCLTYDPLKRITAEVALQHSYFRDHKPSPRNLSDRYTERKDQD